MLFDIAKYQIIIKRNVMFDENTSSIKLFNSSSDLLHSDPFVFVEETRSIGFFFGISTK